MANISKQGVFSWQDDYMVYDHFVQANILTIILKEDDTTRTVYLPGGTVFLDFETGAPIQPVIGDTLRIGTDYGRVYEALVLNKAEDRSTPLTFDVPVEGSRAVNIMDMLDNLYPGSVK